MSAVGGAIGRARYADMRVPKWLRGAALAALGATAVVFGIQLTPQLNPPVRFVTVQGQFKYLSASKIAAAAAVSPSTHLFSIDLGTVRQRIEALPWVASVQIARVWPEQLRITVRERQPLVRWDGASLLDTDGQVFTPSPAQLKQPALAGLPQLTGPASQSDEVLDAWRVMQPALAGGPFALAGLRINARGSWQAKTVTGIELRLGQGDPTRKVALLNGVVANALSARMADVASVDLRYTNGFAVAWRKDKTTSTTEGKSK